MDHIFNKALASAVLVVAFPIVWFIGWWDERSLDES